MISTRRPMARPFALLAAAALAGPAAGAQEPARDAAAAAAAASRAYDLTATTTTTAGRPPFDLEQSRRNVAFWESRARRDPGGFLELRELAGSYLALGRETGDIADAVRAEDAARRSLAIQGRGNVAARLRLAQALLAQHRFPEALDVLRPIAQDERGVRLLIDVRIETGDYDEAIRALETIPTDPDDLNLRALRARFEDLAGRPERAHDLMVEAAAGADARPDMAAEAVAWYHTMVGHGLIDRGRLEAGEAACRKALTIFPSDYRAMTGMAEAAAWRGDHASALDWANRALRVSGQNPEALRLAGEASAAMGRPAEAAASDRALEALARSFPRIYDRHWALFLADRGRDLDEALALARKDLELRRDIHAHDTLAWACFKKGLLDEAGREMALALARGTREAPLLEHAAAIAEARGLAAEAASYRTQAEQANPYVTRAAAAADSGAKR